VGRLERGLLALLWLGLGTLACLLLASPFLLSLQADEAWNLLPIQTLVTSGVYTHPSAPPARMSGGPYLLVQSLVLWLGGDSLPALRAFPAACLVLLVVSVAAWARRSFSSGTAALLAPCVLLAVPGTLGLGSAAFAVVPATLLLFWGVLAWSERPGLPSALLAGALFGLATASRTNIGLILPLLLAVAAAHSDRKQELPRALAATAVGAALFVACFAALALVGDTSTDITLSRAVFVTGIGSDLGLRQLLQKWVIANGFLWLPLLAAATLAALALGRRSPALARATGLLAGFGWCAWGAWLVIAPLPHLRYLWPALASFAALLGLGLAALHEWGRERSRADVRVAALALGVTCLMTGNATTYRNLALGDLNFLTWEWAEATPLSARADFRLARQQRRMANALRALPDDAAIAALDFGLELEFLSGRPVPPLAGFMNDGRWQTDDLPRRLVTTTHLGRRGHLDPRATAWLRAHCELEARFGPYALWRVVGRFPEDPGVLQFSVGPAQPYAGWPRRVKGAARNTAP